jgi:membrane protease YdiL (CAAX protease family)
MQSNERSLADSSPQVRYFLLTLFILYYLPPLLLWAGVLPFVWRFQILAIMTGALIVYDYRRGVSLKELGFRRDTLKASLIFNTVVSVVLVILMISSFEKGLIRTAAALDGKLFFVYYLFISAPSQEFLFRSNLFALMQRAGVRGTIPHIAVSAVTYSFLHIIYNDPITLAATFVVGLMWGWVYHNYPNFWGVAISHAVLGAISIKVGII